MGWIEKRRDTAGNVVLLLVAVVLFTAVFGVAASLPASASAADVTVTQQSPSTGTGSYTLLVNLAPSTSIDQNIVVQIWDETRGGALGTANATTNSGNVIAGVYSDLITSSVYNGTYLQLTDSLTSFTGLSVYSASYAPPVSGTVYYTVYLAYTLNNPPNTGGTGTTTGTTEDTVGTIQQGTENGYPLFLLDAVSLDQALQSSASTVTVKVPDQGEANATMGLDPDTLKKIIASGKSVTIEYQGASIIIPPAVLDMPGLQASGAAMSFTIGALPDDQAKTYQDDANDQPGTKSVSKIYQLGVGFLSNGVITHYTGLFEKPVKADFAYNGSPDVDPGALGAYSLIDGTWKYAGGTVDSPNHTVSADLWHMSTWAVLSYVKTFTDTTNHWAKDDIALMASKHVVDGMTATTFEPDATITRAQFATMIIRALNLPLLTPDTSPFSDVKKSDWFYGDVATAASQGLVNGVGDGKFDPNGLITREEMAAIVVRAAAAQGTAGTMLTASEADTALSHFADGADVSDWAKVEMAEAVQDGLINGRDTGLAAGANSTRAEGATLAERFMDFVGVLGDH